jgi:HPt (histidine-containing phosphotransfer) domain-containing protein
MSHLDMSTMSQWKDFYKDDWKTVIGELIDLFKANSLGRFDQLVRELQSKSYKEAQQSAHFLRSSCAYIGGMKISKMLGELESELNSGRADITLERLNALQEDFTAFWNEVKVLQSQLN